MTTTNSVSAPKSVTITNPAHPAFGHPANLLFIDTETGGLDAIYDPLVEVALVGLVGPPRTWRIPHNPNGVKPSAAAVNGYIARRLGDPTTWASLAELADLRESLEGVTLVGANTAFDAASVKAWLFPVAEQGPWNYRLLDIESMAFQAGIRSAKTGSVPGLMDIVVAVREWGYWVPDPDHTATADVLATRDCYLALTGGRRGVGAAAAVA